MVILGSILLLSMVFAPSSFIKPWKSCVLPRRSEALQFWFICRGLPGEWRDRFWWFFVRIPNLIESASMLFFLNDARIRWPKNNVTRISHTLNFGAIEVLLVVSECLMLISHGLLISSCWVDAAYDRHGSLGPTHSTSSTPVCDDRPELTTILRCVFEVYSLCKTSLALGDLLRMISWTIHSCLFWFRDSEPIDRADSHSSHCVWELQNIQFMSGWCFSFFNSFSSGF